MHTNRQAEYALWLMQRLAVRPDEYLTLAHIAQDLGVSASVIKPVARALSDTGLVLSKEGSGGGYMLALKSESITLAQIIESVTGQVSVSQCSDAGHVCRLGHASCPMAEQMSAVNEAVTRTLRQQKLSSLVV